MAMEFSGLPFVYKIDLCYASILVNLCLFYPVVSYQPRLWTRLLENALGSCSCSLLYIFFLVLLLGTLEAGAVYDNLVVHSNVLVLTHIILLHLISNVSVRSSRDGWNFNVSDLPRKLTH